MPKPRRRLRVRCNIRPETRVRCPGHLQHVRSYYFCLVANKKLHTCFGKPEAHHIRRGTDGALGIKPSDSFAIPACSNAHREIHDHGEATFEKKYDVNLLDFADKIWRMSPARIRWERKMEQAG